MIRCFPDKLPIGIERNDTSRFVFLYLVNRRVPVDFRQFLEGAFADELALLQPTPGYMRLVKDRILHVWEQRRAEGNDRTVAQQRRVSAIQQKMDKLDEAFLYSEAIDVTT